MFPFFSLVESKRSFLQHFVYVWKRKILALGIAAFLQAASKQSGMKNAKMKHPPSSHSPLQPVLGRTIPLPCQYYHRLLHALLLPVLHVLFISEMKRCWVQEEKETTDFKTVCHKQNLLKLCCFWHLCWLKEEQKENILFPHNVLCLLLAFFSAWTAKLR